MNMVGNPTYLRHLPRWLESHGNAVRVGVATGAGSAAHITKPRPDAPSAIVIGCLWRWSGDSSDMHRRVSKLRRRDLSSKAAGGRSTRMRLTSNRAKRSHASLDTPKER